MSNTNESLGLNSGTKLIGGKNNVFVGVDNGCCCVNGDSNTSVGFQSLYSDVNGVENVAIGTYALKNNIASYNVACGFGGLFNNVNGQLNVAIGYKSLYLNTNGTKCIAIGSNSMCCSITGLNNISIGCNSLSSITSATDNVVIGNDAAINLTDSHNIVIGGKAAQTLVSGSYNIFIGDNVDSNSSTANTIKIGSNFKLPDSNMELTKECYIDGIRERLPGAEELPVFIGSDGKIGTLLSNFENKTNIKYIDQTNYLQLFDKLEPVSFNYLNSKSTQFGLLTEDVKKVMPELVTSNSVQYHKLTSLLIAKVRQLEKINKQMRLRMDNIENKLR